MKKPINEIKKMQLIAGLITESEYQESLMNENEPNIKKIGKYITVETDEDGYKYPDLNDQAISDYLKSVIDPKYIKDVKTFMNDEEGYDESRSYFFDDEYYDSISDEKVEEWARQEMSHYLFSQPDEFPGKEMNESPVNESETKTFSAMQPIIDDLVDGMVTLDSLMSRDTGENSLQQAAKRQGLKGLSIKMIELWTELSKSI